MSEKPKKILVLLGHPDAQSYCGALAHAYVDGARGAGHTVELLALGALAFEPVLKHGYKEIQPLEPDLVRATELLKSSDHLVWVYPSWWGGIPALMKGFVERVFLPGVAFKYRANSALQDRLWTGKSARIIVTMDAPTLWDRIMYRSAGVNQLKRPILHFCGISPVRATRIGRVRFLTDMQRRAILRQVESLGKSGA